MKNWLPRMSSSTDRAPLLKVASMSAEEIQKNVEQNTIRTVSSGYVKIAVIALFFGLSVLFYNVREGWSVADSFLFVIITISTVGYGTIHPTSSDTRIFTIFLMIFGVVAIFSTLTSFVSKGMKRLKVYFSNSVVSRLKQTEWVFQQRLYFSIIWIVVCAFLGAVVLQQLEGWDFISCIYFIVETITTVGYGDFTVEKEATKIFLCFYIVISVTLLGLAIQNLYSLIRNRKVLAQRKELLKLQQKLHFLADMNAGRGVNKWEFVLTILEHIGTLDHDKDIEPWLQKFQEMDKANDGVLNQQQLAQFSQSNEKECEEQIELLTLSASNLNAVPRARRESVWAMGLLTDNDELFGRGEDEEEVEGSCSSAFGDSESQHGGEEHGSEAGEVGVDQHGAPRGSRRASSARARGRPRNYSTATNVSDRGGWRGWDSPARSSSPTPSVVDAAGTECGDTFGGMSGGPSWSTTLGLGGFLPSIASALFVPASSSSARTEHDSAAESAVSPLHVQGGTLGPKSVSSAELSALGKVSGVEMV